MILCVTEHEHRDRAIADDVLQGRFTVAGETRALGTDPDWLDAALPEDEEWRIEWVKFAWGLDLAQRATGALLATTGGAGVQLDDPAQRLVREAAFYTVQAQTAPGRDATLRSMLHPTGPSLAAAG